MYWKILLLLVVFTPVTAFAQQNENAELLSYIDVVADDTTSGTPAARITLLDGDEIVGYAWRMAPEVEAPNLPHAIFAPGFSASDSDTPPPAGSVESYLQLARQLNVDAGRNFPAWLVRETNSVVWLIDYLERRGAIDSNSRAIQALLTSDDFINDLGIVITNGSIYPMNAVLYGYSMGGMVAKHALLSLEADNVAHRVGAYVSLDSPHRGAFIPPALEVYSRTLKHMLGSGLDNVLIGSVIGEDIDLAVDLYDSPAAKQLLGIYTGKAVKSDKVGAYPNAGKTRFWRELEAEYNAMRNNNALARHPDFYRIREDIVDLGSYPTLTLNVGVSFGNANGQQLMDPTARSMKPLDFRAELEPNTRVMAGHLKTIRGQVLCRVETTAFELGRSCPELRLNNQHLQHVFVGPGSVADSFGRLSDELGASGWEPNDLVRAGIGLAGIAVNPIIWIGYEGVDVRVTVEESDRILTFVPMVSAFDAKGWAATYPEGVPINQLSTPFDVNIADQRGANTPRSHEIISVDVIDQIIDTLDSANVTWRQKMRIGTIGNVGASPTSNYWNTAGVFDTARYILPQSIRELPVVRDAAADLALSVNRDDQSLAAAIISAL